MPRIKPEKLVGETRARALAELEGWSEVEGRDAIRKDYRFRDFVEAWAFMSSVALVAQVADHHPEWTNVWNRVQVVLTTHEASGLTQRDIELARSMDELARNRVRA